MCDHGAVCVGVRLLSVALFVSGAVHASVYHVAPGGTGNGSQATPFGSFASFDAVAVAGDTCWVHGGTYMPPGTILLTADGSTDAPICLFAWPGEAPVIDGRRATDDAALNFAGTDWWHVRGLEVTNTQGEWIAGVQTTGTVSHIVFEQLNTHHNRFVGLMISGAATDILVLNCDSHHNVDSDYEDADGFQVYPTTHARIVYRGCRAWNNADDGWDLFFATAGSILIDSCWAFGNGYADDGSELGDGNGYKLGGATSDPRVASSGGHRVQRSVAFGNKYCGFNENTDLGAAPDTLYNNTGYDNRGWRDFDFDCGLVHVLRNNVSVATAGAAVGPSVSDHNSWNPGYAVTEADFVGADAAGVDGPRQADGSLPATSFLKPAEGGALVDRGVDVGLGHDGPAPELGAYELALSTVPGGAACPPDRASQSEGVSTLSLLNGRSLRSSLLQPVRALVSVVVVGGDRGLSATCPGLQPGH